MHKKYKILMIKKIENVLNSAENNDLSEHLKSCKKCIKIYDNLLSTQKIKLNLSSKIPALVIEKHTFVKERAKKIRNIPWLRFASAMAITVLILVFAINLANNYKVNRQIKYDSIVDNYIAQYEQSLADFSVKN